MARLVREPIYQQLNTQLREHLRSGEFPIGSQFLTERQIAERFEVSRITANKALASLVAEGLLDFRKGVGTFVREPRLDYDLRALVSFSDKAKAAGLTPSSRVLRTEALVGKDAPQAARLGLHLGEEAPCYAIERLRLADGKPLIVERRIVVAEFCPKLLDHDLSQSLYQLWQNQYHLNLCGADQTIRAINVDETDARLLGVAPGAAALEVECVGRLQGGQALWWECTRYRGDGYTFHGSMGSAHPAIAGVIG